MAPPLQADLWSPVEGVPCALGNNVASAVGGLSVSSFSGRSSWLTVLPKVSVCSIVFCLVVLTILKGKH